MKAFITHTGKVIKGKALKQVLNAVAEDLIANAYAIHTDNEYADHVTQTERDEYLQQRLATAERIRIGNVGYELWVFQRLDTKLTGECIGLLP